MSQSKADKVHDFIKSVVIDQVRESVTYSIMGGKPDQARIIADLAGELAAGVAYRIVHRPYAFKELKDIMDWKQPPEVR